MLVPFLDLRREVVLCRTELDQAIARVLDRGRFILGPELDSLEAEFAGYLKVPFSVGVGSGTDALTLALEGLGAITRGAGHEVLTSAFSAAFTPLAIIRAGAIPRFVDIDPETLQIDPVLAESCINERTRAIVPVHLYGNPCNISAIMELARKHGLPVIEDACQAHGSRWNGRMLGTFGNASAFSFYPTKNMGALGDGGIVATSDGELAARIRRLRHGGQSRTYVHEDLGCNSRLDELQAAVLRIKLARLDERNRIRCEIAGRYDEAFAGLDLKRVKINSGAEPNRHIYPVRSRRREEMRRFLLDCNIETLVHYPAALPCQPALKPFASSGSRFPAAENAAEEIFSLPVYPELRTEEIDYLIETVRRFFDGSYGCH
jgi:dTDP-4-amino-4,6-dideoxygalactose transaminase